MTAKGPLINKGVVNLFDAPENGKDSNWVDTDGFNSMDVSDFMSYADSSGAVYGNSFDAAEHDARNVHSHYAGEGARKWANYKFTGAMMIDDIRGSIGVTFYSDYPRSDFYYRIRRYIHPRSDMGYTANFHLAPHPDDGSEDYHLHCSTEDNTATGELVTDLSPLANEWYRFEITTTTHPMFARIQAVIYQESNPDSAGIIDCYDYSPQRLPMGTVGIWYEGNDQWRADFGQKYFKDFQVEFLDTP